MYNSLEDSEEEDRDGDYDFLEQADDAYEMYLDDKINNE